MRDAASRIRVEIATLPGLLYRVSTPPGSGLAPRVTGTNGRLLASLLPTGEDGPAEVRIMLNRDVRWQISLPAGAGEQQLDLRRGRLSRIDLGSSGLVELRLPRPDRIVPITMRGGVGGVLLTTAPGTPLRVRLDRGAGSWLGGAPAGPGTVWQAGTWPATLAGYGIRTRSSVGAFSLRTVPPT